MEEDTPLKTTTKTANRKTVDRPIMRQDSAPGYIGIPVVSVAELAATFNEAPVKKTAARTTTRKTTKRAPWLRVRVERPDGSLYTDLSIPPRTARALRTIAAESRVSVEDAVKGLFAEGLELLAGKRAASVGGVA
jgi:hypothetical protein